MEEQEFEMEEQKTYHPRPAWQVWVARLAVVIVAVAFLLYCYQIANGGR